MTNYEALYNLFNSFGMTAYPRGTDIEDAELPYLTYEVQIGQDADITVHTYHYTSSEAIPNAKAEEICSAFRNGGKIVPYDGGALWITLGNPEWYPSPDEEDPKLKHRLINMNIKDLSIR